MIKCLRFVECSILFMETLFMNFCIYRISRNIGGHYFWRFARYLAEMHYWGNLYLAVCEY